MDDETEAQQQACLDTFRLMTQVPQACGHVTELHHNNMALEDKHFAVLVPLRCPWCAATESGVDPEQVAQALKYHGHMRFWGELVAFKRAELTAAEWHTIRDMEEGLRGTEA